MTEQSPTPGPDAIAPENPAPEAVDPDAAENDAPIRTGIPSVDGVLSEIDGLDELPLEQHLATFERAHDTLRSALDAPTGPAADDPA